jgi:hypothetical protein
MAQMDPPNIAVISSITCGQSFKKAFEVRLNATLKGTALEGVPSITYFDQVGYNSQLLKDAVISFTNDTTIGLIVTFGGMIAFNAANSAVADANRKSFISLTGADRGSQLPCLGGVSLESFARNQPKFGPVTFAANGNSFQDTTNFLVQGDKVAFSFSTVAGGALPTNITPNTTYSVTGVAIGPPNRITLSLNGAPVNNTGANPGTGVLAWAKPNRIEKMCNHFSLGSGSDISLLYHSTSGVADLEIAAWQGGTIISPGPPVVKTGFPPAATGVAAGTGGPAVPINVNKSFADALDGITTKAVIISADPYFQDNKEALIKAANESPLFVGYPLNDYRNRGGTHKPAGRGALIYGPNLEEAINGMGTLAANVLLNVPIAIQPFSSAAYSNAVFL